MGRAAPEPEQTRGPRHPVSRFTTPPRANQITREPHLRLLLHLTPSDSQDRISARANSMCAPKPEPFLISSPRTSHCARALHPPSRSAASCFRPFIFEGRFRRASPPFPGAVDFEVWWRQPGPPGSLQCLQPGPPGGCNRAPRVSARLRKRRMSSPADLAILTHKAKVVAIFAENRQNEKGDEWVTGPTARTRNHRRESVCK